MRRGNRTRPLVGLTLALVGLMSWITQAATNITHNLSPSSQAPKLTPRANGKIAYVSGGSDNEIHVINADGSNQMNITDSIGADGTLSPDGKRIAFTRGDIYVMNADGSDTARLTNDPAID